MACALALAMPQPALGQYTNTAPTRPDYNNPYPERPGQVAPDTGPQNTGQRAVRFEPWIEVEETATSNANFDRGPDKKADLVTTLTPGFRINADGAHGVLRGVVSVPIYLYVRTGADNNRAIPAIHLLGTVHEWDKRVYLDGGIDTSREFITALGARPAGAEVNTANEYVSQSYRVTPGLRGDLGPNARFDLHDDNTWTKVTQGPSGLLDSYLNDLNFLLTRDPTPFGAQVQYDHTSVRFEGEAPLLTEITRLRGDYEVDPQLRLSLIGGYEDDDYALARFSDVIYGVAARWRPTDRTSLDATWEHRFFGSSYVVSFDHHTPRTVWSVRASRDVSSYPQQLASLQPGSVTALLNSIFASVYPDPVQRQQAIDLLIRTYGLPSELTGPVSLYTQRATLTTDFRFVAGFNGARNNVFFTVYRHNDQTIVGSNADPFTFDHVDQRGVNLVWSSRVDPLATLTGILDYNRSIGDSIAQHGTTTNASASLTLSRPLGAYTEGHIGTRYQFARSDFFQTRNEVAIYAGVLYRFY